MSVFAGLSFAFAGRFSVKTNALKALVLDNGGEVKDEVDGKTNYIIVGSNPGAKINHEGVPLMTEKFVTESIESQSLAKDAIWKRGTKRAREVKEDAVSKESDDVKRDADAPIQTELFQGKSFFLHDIENNDDNKKKIQNHGGKIASEIRGSYVVIAQSCNNDMGRSAIQADVEVVGTHFLDACIAASALQEPWRYRT